MFSVRRKQRSSGEIQKNREIEREISTKQIKYISRIDLQYPVYSTRPFTMYIHHSESVGESSLGTDIRGVLQSSCETVMVYGPVSI